MMFLISLNLCDLWGVSEYITEKVFLISEDYALSFAWISRTPSYRASYLILPEAVRRLRSLEHPAMKCAVMSSLFFRTACIWVFPTPKSAAMARALLLPFNGKGVFFRLFDSDMVRETDSCNFRLESGNLQHFKFTASLSEPLWTLSGLKMIQKLTSILSNRLFDCFKLQNVLKLMHK